MTKITKDMADKAYREGNPLMSDAEYDAKFGLDASDIDTPDKGSSVWPKEKLTIPMGSLLKVNNFDDLFDWKASYCSDIACWSDKLDGNSGELTYQDGELVKGMTRGNGEIGDNITPNVLKMQVPKNIDLKGTIHVRVEFILFLKDWKDHFSDKKNPRNAAAGSIRRLDGAGCEYIRCLPFDIHGDNVQAESKFEKFELLKSLGFHMPRYGSIDNSTEIADLLGKTESEDRANLPYEIDGIVFEANDLDFYLEQGERSGRPRAARAFKFTSQSAVTTIKDVIWQVGKTGFITPVGILDPTDIGGVTITRVMLNNPSELATLKLGRNCKAELIRANDVIPKIVALHEKGQEYYDIPRSCPSCGKETILMDDKSPIDLGDRDIKEINEQISGKKARLKCPNQELCPAQTEYRIVYYLKSIDVKGFGDETVSKLLDAELISDPADLYTVNTVKFAELEGLSEKIVDKLLKELHTKSSKITLPNFIKALSIPGISASSAELIMGKFANLEQMRKATVDELLTIDGLGEFKANCFVDGIKAKSDLIDKLLPWVTVDTPVLDGKFSGSSFCFTGFRDKNAEEKIKELGGTIKSSATKDLTYLVAKNPDGRSSKLEKARKNGTQVIGIDDMLVMLEEQ